MCVYIYGYTANTVTPLLSDLPLYKSSNFYDLISSAATVYVEVR